MQRRVPKVVLLALVLISSACTSFGGGSDVSGGDVSYAEMASHLRTELPDIVWVMDVAGLEDQGVVDRDADGDLPLGIYDSIAEDYRSFTALPGPWHVARAHAFAWPDSEPVIGAVPEDADVIVTDTISTVLRVPEVIDEVEDTLTELDAWDSPGSIGDGPWTWTGDPSMADSDDEAEAALDAALTEGEYQATIMGHLLTLTSNTAEAAPLAEPILELLEFVDDAHLVHVVDGCRGLQAPVSGTPDEPAGGYIPPVLAVGFTVRWSDGEPSEQMHLLFADDESAGEAASSLEVTLAEEPAAAVVVGDDASVSRNDRVVTLTPGRDAETDLAFQVQRSRQAAGPLVTAFAPEEACEPLER